MDSRIWQQGHLTEYILEEYAFGRLEENDSAIVEEHYLGCGLCQHALAKVEEEIQTIRGAFASDVLHRPEAPVSIAARIARWFREIGQMRQPALGAALAAVIVVAVAVYGWQSSRQALTPANVLLASFRGADPSEAAQGPANRPLILRMNPAGISDPARCRVEIVDVQGGAVWSGTLSGTGDQIEARTPQGFGAGQFWVRVYGSDNSLVREFGLQLK